MSQVRIFISNVQKQFLEEHKALRGDPLLSRFFDVFLFEDVPAVDRLADQVYLQEVERCEIYVGLLDGNTESKVGKAILLRTRNSISPHSSGNIALSSYKAERIKPNTEKEQDPVSD